MHKAFFLSAFFLGLIKHTEPAKAVTLVKRNIWREIGEGLGVVFGNRYLRSIAACTGTGNFFGEGFRDRLVASFTRRCLAGADRR